MLLTIVLALLIVFYVIPAVIGFVGAMFDEGVWQGCGCLIIILFILLLMGII
jgi:hypothetical protein